MGSRASASARYASRRRDASTPAAPVAVPNRPAAPSVAWEKMLSMSSSTGKAKVGQKRSLRRQEERREAAELLTIAPLRFRLKRYGEGKRREDREKKQKLEEGGHDEGGGQGQDGSGGGRGKADQQIPSEDDQTGQGSLSRMAV